MGRLTRRTGKGLTQRRKDAKVKVGVFGRGASRAKAAWRFASRRIHTFAGALADRNLTAIFPAQRRGSPDLLHEWMSEYRLLLHLIPKFVKISVISVTLRIRDP